MKYYCVKCSADNRRLNKQDKNSLIFAGELLTAKEICNGVGCCVDVETHPFFVAVDVPRNCVFWIFGTRRTSDKYTPVDCRF